MELTDKLEAVAMAAVAAEALVRALMIPLILYKADREELAVVAAAVASTNLVRRLRQGAILLAAVAAAAVDLLTAPMPQADLIQEISVEDLEELAPIASDRVLVAEVVVAEAVLEALSLWIAI